MRKLLNKRKRGTFTGSKLQGKIIVIYLLMCILPIFMVSLLAYRIYYNNMLEQAYSRVEQNSRQHETILTERLDIYKTVLYEILTDNRIIKLSQNLKRLEDKELLVSKADLEVILKSYVYTYDAIKSIAFLGDNGQIVEYSKYYGSFDTTLWSDKEKRNKLYQTVNEEGGLCYLAAVNLSRIKNRADYVILMGFPVRNLVSKKQTGILLLALDDYILLFNQEKGEFDEGSNPKDGIQTLIVDEKNRILAESSDKYIAKSYKYVINQLYSDKSDLLEWKRDIEGTKWQIINVVDKAVYLKDIHFFEKIVILLTAIITLLFFVIVICISRKYINTITKIARGIGKYAGSPGEEINVEIDKEDELYVIARQFHYMTRRVNRLVEKLKHKNIEIEEAVTSQKHAEIKALEAQINPHFLYNTLDSINWRAIEHGEEEISDMLGTLGSLLRYSVSNIDMVVLLSAEISWLRKYIFLQRDRFHYSFDCEYDIQEEAYDFPVYKMLLQPLIENTILHAFEDVKEGGLIFVKSYVMEDGRLYISIKDNGRGMEEEKLKEIQAGISEDRPLNSNSIGISNIVNRLKIYYHGKAELSVFSTFGEGTEFIMLLPDVS
ncbi:sensor histidine kinase [Anaerocolumna sp. MB42-C2]|uniref:sensor histidine kinase n=1 Tax=Anaerocolumna sp. MB42-C2 TaxID=3070997 RepID=UPI0027E0C83A|nr:sensor histidine kinase [Anaerocolumna sp. MB42-C2]WMJ90262.1 sensor histidine kinase [Anaerocolumna sp. MB42-C2]